MEATTVKILLFVLSFLLTVLIGLTAFIGNGFNKRIDKVDKKFGVVFAEFKEYQSKEICEIHRNGIDEKTEKNADDINKVGKKLSEHIEDS